MIFFSADHHFGHANIIKLSKRPYANAAEMTERLVEEWNATVKPEDTVYYLGDFAWKIDVEATAAVAARLNGEVHFLYGNHDEVLRDVYKTAKIPARWTWMQPIHELGIGVKEQKIVLCHYAMRTWNQKERGSWHLYGHSHGALPPLGRSVDVGVDSIWGYKPVSFDQIAEFMKDRS